MSHRIRCYTLFDITYTGTLNRQPSKNFTKEQLLDWQLKRNSQSNLDTILQIISLRCQPEECTVPVMKKIDFSQSNHFGFLFENEEAQNYWVFDFSVFYDGAFFDGIDQLGALLSDCNGVPMTQSDRAWDKLPDFLDTSVEVRNIYFEVLNNA